VNEIPHDEEAERGLIGSLILDAVRVGALMRGPAYALTPEAFYQPAHALLVGAVFGMLAGPRAAAVDLITLSDELRRSGDLEKVGGAAYLERCVDATPTADHAEYYAGIVRAKWMLRAVLRAAEETREDAHKPDADGDALASAAVERFTQISRTAEPEESNDEVLAVAVREFEDARAFADGDKSKRPAIGYETPWPVLTQILCGIEKGQMLVVAGRPSAGKTTLEGEIARWLCMKGMRVGRASMDTSRKQLLQRMLAREAGVSLPKLKQGFARHDQLERVREARPVIARLDMAFNDRDRDVDAVCTWARAQRMRFGLDVLTLDYAQQYQAARLGWQAQNPVQRVTYISGQLKSLAVELDIPVVVLSQLSRSVETEGRESPEMHDLRDSGAVEQDADKILMLAVSKWKRKEMEEDDPDATKHKRPVLFDVVKHKNGETGRLAMWLYPPYFRFDGPASGGMVEVADKKGNKRKVWRDWTDDELPEDAGETAREWEESPEAEPQEEHDARPPPETGVLGV
jgi:replicative DNA helicase